jgi:hypothetical protein
LAQIIFKSAYFFSDAKVWRNDSQEAPRFAESAKNFLSKVFSSLPELFFSLFHFPKKDMQEVKCNVRTKRKGVKQKSQSKAKQKVTCVPLKLSENSFCKKNVKS